MCNRARLNFQVCALRDVKMALEWVKRWVVAQGFANKTKLALEEVLIAMFRTSRVIHFRFDGETQ